MFIGAGKCFSTTVSVSFTACDACDSAAEQSHCKITTADPQQQIHDIGGFGQIQSLNLLQSIPQNSRVGSSSQS